MATPKYRDRPLSLLERLFGPQDWSSIMARRRRGPKGYSRTGPAILTPRDRPKGPPQAVPPAEAPLYSRLKKA